MPIQRNQPSPERQSVLTFVSPSVADLLFFETVDAKTVGAGSGKTITNSIKSTANLASGATDGPDSQVESGQHTHGFSVSFTSAAHGYDVNDVVVIRDVVCSGVSLNGRHRITAKNDDNFTVFVKDDPATISLTGDSRVHKEHPNYGTAHPDTENFPTHKLCHVAQSDPNGLTFQYYYAADRLHQDEYNFEYSQADLGGNQYDTVVRTYVTLRSDFDEADSKYDAGDKMPEVPAGKFPDDIYILMTRQQKRIGDKELDGLFVVEQRVYFRYEDKVSFNADPEFGNPLKTTEILAYRGKTSVPVISLVGSSRTEQTVTWSKTIAETASYWGITDNGINYEVVRLSNDWWKITKQEVVPEDLTGGGVTYYTIRNYSFPAELIGFRFTTINRKDGGTENSVTTLKKDSFSGPIEVAVNRKWQNSAPTQGSYTPTVFKPTSGSYSGAQFKLSYSNVLTKAFTLVDTIGTSHPVYKQGAYASNFFQEATEPSAQPSSGSSINMGQTVRPFRGGFLIETLTGKAP